MFSFFSRKESLAEVFMDQLVEDLRDGVEYGVPLDSPKRLEAIKDAAYPVMGPLWVTVDVANEMYRIKRDNTLDVYKHPGRWG